MFVRSRPIPAISALLDCIEDTQNDAWMNLSARPIGQSCLAGVRLKDGEELRAELVVDASGRRSKLPSWLEAAGYERPEEALVDSHIGYSMRLYEMPEKACSLSLLTPCIVCCFAHQPAVKVIRPISLSMYCCAVGRFQLSKAPVSLICG